MESIQELRAELSRLEGLAAEIRNQGRVIQHPSFWFDSARNRAKTIYYRKRWFDESGRKHSEVISKEKMDVLKAEIARGSQLSQLEGQASEVQQKLDRAMEIARSLGLEVPY